MRGRSEIEKNVADYRHVSAKGTPDYARGGEELRPVEGKGDAQSPDVVRLGELLLVQLS